MIVETLDLAAGALGVACFASTVTLAVLKPKYDALFANWMVAKASVSRLEAANSYLDNAYTHVQRQLADAMEDRHTAEQSAVRLEARVNELEAQLQVALRNDKRDPVTGRFVKGAGVKPPAKPHVVWSSDPGSNPAFGAVGQPGVISNAITHPLTKSEFYRDHGRSYGLVGEQGLRHMSENKDTEQ